VDFSDEWVRSSKVRSLGLSGHSRCVLLVFDLEDCLTQSFHSPLNRTGERSVYRTASRSAWAPGKCLIVSAATFLTIYADRSSPDGYGQTIIAVRCLFVTRLSLHLAPSSGNVASAFLGPKRGHRSRLRSV